jgi:hypothetical protein
VEGIGTPDMRDAGQDRTVEGRIGVREAARTTQLPNWWGSMDDRWGRCAPRKEIRDLCRVGPVFMYVL